MRWHTVAGLGLCLVGLAVSAGSYLFYRTRTLVPVDVPITLSLGHFSKEFTPNLTAPYEIEIKVKNDTANQNNLSLATLYCLLGMPRTISPEKCDNTPQSLRQRGLSPAVARS